MNTKTFISLMLLTGMLFGLQAQNFLTPVQSLTGDAVATTESGEEISGDIRGAVFGVRGLMSFTIKDASGQKHKFKAADASKLRVKIDGFAKLEMLAEKTSTLKKMVTADFDEVVDREWIYYEQVKIPGKDKYVLAQLLNPGFDSKIKVYDYPLGKSGTTSVGGMAVAGDESKTYIVVADGTSHLVKKKKYEKEWFGQFFGSCADMTANFQGKDMKFKNFASHVFAFDQGCN